MFKARAIASSRSAAQSAARVERSAEAQLKVDETPRYNAVTGASQGAIALSPITGSSMAIGIPVSNASVDRAGVSAIDVGQGRPRVDVIPRSKAVAAKVVQRESYQITWQYTDYHNIPSEGLAPLSPVLTYGTTARSDQFVATYTLYGPGDATLANIPIGNIKLKTNSPTSLAIESRITVDVSIRNLVSDANSLLRVSIAETDFGVDVISTEVGRVDDDPIIYTDNQSLDLSLTADVGQDDFTYSARTFWNSIPDGFFMDYVIWDFSITWKIFSVTRI